MLPICVRDTWSIPSIPAIWSTQESQVFKSAAVSLKNYILSGSLMNEAVEYE